MSAAFASGACGAIHASNPVDASPRSIDPETTIVSTSWVGSAALAESIIASVRIAACNTGSSDDETNTARDRLFSRMYA